MFSEAKVTEIYCMADDFCKEFAKAQEKYMVEDRNHKHRNKPFCSTPVVSAASSIITRSMSANI